MQTIQEKAQIAVRAAAEKSMTGRIWQKSRESGEVRVYLRRTNAAQTDAGYIRIWEEGPKAYSQYVHTATGTGSRTAATEAEAAYSHYKTIRQSLAAK